MKKIVLDDDEYESEDDVDYSVSAWTTSGVYFIGWREWSDSSVQYIFHSIRIHDNEGPGENENLIGATFNRKFLLLRSRMVQRVRKWSKKLRYFFEIYYEESRMNCSTISHWVCSFNFFSFKSFIILFKTPVFTWVINHWNRWRMRWYQLVRWRWMRFWLRSRTRIYM